MSNGSGIRCKDHEVGCRLDISILPQLIPDPVWNTDSFASQYHNAGSGISDNTEEPQRGVVADPGSNIR